MASWQCLPTKRNVSVKCFMLSDQYECWRWILTPLKCIAHYGDVIMGAIASQITSLTIVYSTVYSDADQRKHQSSALLAFVREIHRGPVNSPHKWLVTRKMFPFDDVIMADEDPMPEVNTGDCVRVGKGRYFVIFISGMDKAIAFSKWSFLLSPHCVSGIWL